ncbi:hypothetical protein FOA52_013260 [Chlamydomonas sp. UWO 241]|nr:hypothetical protein FOA52_013260 [Chlamydomonas sp. UWO 241]
MAREGHLYSAKLSEQAERYQDMVSEMKQLATLATEAELSIEERNLLSVAYKNLVGARRASWRILQSVEQSETAKGNDARVKLIQGYRSTVEKELDEICGEVLETLGKYLVPSASTPEAAVFYLKMMADYHRYQAEFKSDEGRKAAADLTLAAYQAAQDKAAELSTTNPIRLGLALNFSVFYYEVASQPELACSLAKQAFDDAISDLDSLGEDSYKDSALIMQLLRDNLTLFQTIRFHSIEYYCSDASNTSKRFQHGLGMTLVGKSDLSTGNSQYASYVLRSNDLVFTFTAPYSRTAWVHSPPSVTPFPAFDQAAAHDFVSRHGLAVRAVGLEVEDADAAFKASVEGGAIPVMEPIVLNDVYGTATVAEVLMYGDVVMRFISGDYTGPFLPNYEVVDAPKITYGIVRLDHAVGNVPCLADTVNYITGFTGFHEFAEFTTEDVGTIDSGLNSKVLACNNEMVLMPINEPTHGTPRKSQIQTFLEQNEGPGLQHLALKTNNIFRTVREMQARSDYGGFGFMPRPSVKYYKELPNKIGDALTADQYKEVEELGILADRDDQGVLLQIFTKPLGDRPTVFIEIIERVGCMKALAAGDSCLTKRGARHKVLPEAAGIAPGTKLPARQGVDVDFAPDDGGAAAGASGAAASASSTSAVKLPEEGEWAPGGAVDSVVVEQAAGCGGFGKGNFSELFKRIEDYERTLSIQNASYNASASGVSMSSMSGVSLSGLSLGAVKDAVEEAAEASAA